MSGISSGRGCVDSTVDRFHRRLRVGVRVVRGGLAPVSIFGVPALLAIWSSGPRALDFPLVLLRFAVPSTTQHPRPNMHPHPRSHAGLPLSCCATTRRRAILDGGNSGTRGAVSSKSRPCQIGPVRACGAPGQAAATSNRILLSRSATPPPEDDRQSACTAAHHPLGRVSSAAGTSFSDNVRTSNGCPR
jgi:hypothetical protein